jgi:hypothetical protein
MRSKHFIWIAHVPICLWEFSLDFWDFMSIFSALNELTGVSLEFVCTENVFQRKEKNPILSFQAEPGGPTRFGPPKPSAQPSTRPSQAHLAESAMACTAMHGAVAASPWRACQGSLAPRSLGVHAYLRRGRARGRAPYPAAKPCRARSRAPPALPPSGSLPRDASGASRRRKQVHKAKLQLHRQPPSRVNPCSAAARVRPESAASTAGRPFGFCPPPSASAAGEHPHVVSHTSSIPCAPCLSPSSLEPPAIWPPWPPASPVLSWTEGRRSQAGLHLDPWSSW